jgi:predicted Rossmann fold nucleotide-binding protein DprA/Smf involved in DNA uptake
MGWVVKPKSEDQVVDVDDAVESLSPPQRAVLEAFNSAATLDWPGLMGATGLTMGELSMVIMDLELMGLIRSLPGKRYERV